jgi:hypothetical protein
VLPELAGIGAAPAARASLAGVAKRWAPAISPTKELRRDLLHEFGDLALEPADRLGELARATQLVARDPDAHRRLGASQAPGDPRAPLLREQGGLARGDATHLSSHARHPRPATSDKTKEVRP